MISRGPAKLICDIYESTLILCKGSDIKLSRRGVRHTLQNIVELGDTRRDTEVDALIAEIHHNTTEH
jgi:hypothetical protein